MSMGEQAIDRDYVDQVNYRKKQARISEINHLLGDMNDQQLENVHTYVLNEFAEPNHEAVALEAVVRASREIHA